MWVVNFITRIDCTLFANIHSSKKPNVSFVESFLDHIFHVTRWGRGFPVTINVLRESSQ